MKDLNDAQKDALVIAVLEELTDMLESKYSITILLCDGVTQDLFTNDDKAEELIVGIAEDIRERGDALKVDRHVTH
jgi:hypothetical protein